MKKLIIILLILSMTGVVYALPTVPSYTRDLYPDTTNTWDLGSLTKIWRNLFVGTTTATNLTASNSTLGNATATDMYLSSLGSSIYGLHSAVGEPTGFPNTTDSTISFNNSTRVFTIAPTATSYDYWVAGKKFSTTTATSITIPSTTGQLNLVYFDTTGNLKTTTDTLVFIRDGAQIATVYWDTTEGILGYERHPITMDWASHYYLHTTRGVQYPTSGGGLTGVFASANTFTMTAGQIQDEDNIDNIPATTTARIFYRNGGTVFNFTAKSTPWFYVNAGNVYYDNAGTIQAANSNKYVAYWVFATVDRNNPIYVLMGQREDTTLANAMANNSFGSLTLGQLPSAEMKLLYRVIVRNNSPTFTVADTTDYRTSALNGVVSTVSDHALLSHLDWASSGHTLAKGNFLVGNDDGVPQATSSVFISSTGNLGVGTSSPISILALQGATTTISLSDGTYLQQIINSGAENLAARDLRFALDNTNPILIVTNQGNKDQDFGFSAGTEPTLVVSRKNNNQAAVLNYYSLNLGGISGFQSGSGYTALDITGYSNDSGMSDWSGDVTMTSKNGDVVLGMNNGYTLRSKAVGVWDPDPDFTFEIASSTQKGYFGVSTATSTDGDIFMIDGNGKVGIGTTSPSAKLSIHDMSGLAGTNPVFVIASSTSAGLATSTLLSVLGNGNLGIGTMNPISPLDVYVNSSRVFYVNENSVYSDIGFSSDTFRAATNEQMAFGTANMTSNPIYVVMGTGAQSQSTGNTATLKITPALKQTGNAAATDLWINRTETSLGSGAQYLINAGKGGGSYVSKFNVSNTGNGYFAGNLGIGTTTPSANLDIRKSYSDATDAFRISYTDPIRYTFGIQSYVVSPYNVGYKFHVNNKNDASSTDALMISGIGNIGIRNVNPLAPLAFDTSLGDKIQLYSGTGAARWGFGIQGYSFVQYMDPALPGKFSWRQTPTTGDPSTGTEIANLYSNGAFDLLNATNGVIRAYGSDNNYFKGRVGIGTTDTNFSFEVKDTFQVDSVNGRLFLNNEINGGNSSVGKTLYFQYLRNNFDVDFLHGLITFKGNTGNVGIGTTTPTSLLQVTSETATSTMACTSKSGTKGCSFIMTDTNGTTCTEITTLSGSIISRAVTCP